MVCPLVLVLVVVDKAGLLLRGGLLLLIHAPSLLIDLYKQRFVKLLRFNKKNYGVAEPSLC